MDRKEQANSHIFLNSIPKSGTVLLLRILEPFLIHHKYHSEEWLTKESMHSESFACNEPMLFVGHLYLTPDSFLLARNYRQILLTRHPIDQYCSYVRFLCSKEMLDKGDELSKYIHENNVPPNIVLRFMVEGFHKGNHGWPPYEIEYKKIISWAAHADIVTKYESMKKALTYLKRAKSEEKLWAKNYFNSLLGGVGLSCADRYDIILDAAEESKSETCSNGLTPLVNMNNFPSSDDLLFLRGRLGELVRLYKSVVCFSEREVPAAHREATD